MRTLLVGKVWVVDVGHCGLVGAAQQDASELSAGRAGTAGKHQGRVPEIDEGNFAAVLDAPPVPQVGGEASLATVRYPRGRYLCCHAVALYPRLGTRPTLGLPSEPVQELQTSQLHRVS